MTTGTCQNVYRNGVKTDQKCGRPTKSKIDFKTGKRVPCKNCTRCNAHFQANQTWKRVRKVWKDRAEVAVATQTAPAAPAKVQKLARVHLGKVTNKTSAFASEYKAAVLLGLAAFKNGNGEAVKGQTAWGIVMTKNRRSSKAHYLRGLTRKDGRKYWNKTEQGLTFKIESGKSTATDVAVAAAIASGLGSEFQVMSL